jgi:hypothetical protein
MQEYVLNTTKDGFLSEITTFPLCKAPFDTWDTYTYTHIYTCTQAGSQSTQSSYPWSIFALQILHVLYTLMYIYTHVYTLMYIYAGSKAHKHIHIRRLQSYEAQLSMEHIRTSDPVCIRTYVYIRMYTHLCIYTQAPKLTYTNTYIYAGFRVTKHSYLWSTIAARILYVYALMYIYACIRTSGSKAHIHKHIYIYAGFRVTKHSYLWSTIAARILCDS